ncbi:hypothetical protein RI103_36645 [Paraburkholderia sp. FT54]|nr:hypothetical protein [Paraburkholderia sp. FT54]WNC94667.1 hypothetical protein RI103_36645 [Paraburkholderia sp. FT54]
MIDVVDFRAVSLSDLQDVARFLISRRLASRQTVRVVPDFPMHI